MAANARCVSRRHANRTASAASTSSPSWATRSRAGFASMVRSYRLRCGSAVSSQSIDSVDLNNWLQDVPFRTFAAPSPARGVGALLDGASRPNAYVDSPARLRAPPAARSTGQPGSGNARTRPRQSAQGFFGYFLGTKKVPRSASAERNPGAASDDAAAGLLGNAPPGEQRPAQAGPTEVHGLLPDGHGPVRDQGRCARLTRAASVAAPRCRASR